MLTHKQIRWASQHDWFIRDNGDGTIDVRRDDGSELWWTASFAELRNWARY